MDGIILYAVEGFFLLLGLALLVFTNKGHYILGQCCFYIVAFLVAFVLLVISFISASLILIWNIPEWLGNTLWQRSTAETDVNLMDTEMGKSIQERTSELQRSEEKYRSLIEHASDAIYIHDFTGSFTDVNASMCKLMGYSRAELLRLNIVDIIDPEELKRDPIPEGIISGGESRVRERTFIHKRGSIFTVEINVKRFSDALVFVIARDITDRKKMERELKEAELKFRTIAEKSMVGVYFIQNGKYIYVNSRFAEVFGYEPEELINSVHIDNIIDEDYRMACSEHTRRRMAGEIESVRYESKGRKKDGTSNWVEFYGSRVIIGGIPTIIGSLIDITERKAAEALILKEKLLSDTIISSLPGMFYFYNEKGELLRWNKNLEKVYGYTTEEIKTKNAKTDLIASEDREIVGDAIDKVFGDGYATVEARGVTKEGIRIPFLYTGSRIMYDDQLCLLGTGIDISSRIRAEELFKKSQAHLQTILGTTDTAYALFDTELNILSFNQKAIEFAKKQYGCEPKKGDSLANHFTPERLSKFTDFSMEILKGNNINYEADYSQPDGSALWYQVKLSPIRNDKKEILGMMIALYDITERKLAEYDLTRAYTQIQNQMKSIENMAWRQSHLIRSPLANLKGLVAILADDPLDKETLDHIKKEVDRMDAIIVDIPTVQNVEKWGMKS